MSRQRMGEFLLELAPFLTEEKPASSEELKKAFTELAEQYQHSIMELYGKNRSQELTDFELSTLVNYNRELYTAKKSLLLAVSELMLNPPDASRLRELPGFIR
jgi:phosphate:Na+ symporter